MKKMIKKLKMFFAWILAASLCLTVFPETAVAAGDTDAQISADTETADTEQEALDSGGEKEETAETDIEDPAGTDIEDPADSITETSEEETQEAFAVDTAGEAGEEIPEAGQDMEDEAEEPSAADGSMETETGEPEEEEPAEEPAEEDPEDTADTVDTEDELFITDEPEEDGIGGADSDAGEEALETLQTAELYSVVPEAVSYKYTGERIRPAVTVTALIDDQEIVLEEDTDYTVKYKNNLNAGTASVTVTGAGKYTGTLTAEFKITAVAIKTLTLKYTSKVYTGKAITQTKTAVVTAKVNGQEQVLEYGTDYRISYKNNTEVGMASVTAEGIGNFKSSLTQDFRIIPEAPVLRYLMPGTKRFTAKWYEQNVQTSGYQLQYSEDKDFSTKTTVVIRNTAQVSGTVKSLAAGTTYYVRLRTYKKTDGINYYSRWSCVKAVKLSYNMLTVTGSGTERTVIIHNPKSVKNPEAAVWSMEGSQEDIRWYDLEKHSDGSWRATISLAWLDYDGDCYVHFYCDAGYLGEKIFTVTETEFKATANTIETDGSGVMTTICLLHPVKSYVQMWAAVWSEANGQDDLEWYRMTKNSRGCWRTKANLTNILHSGTVHVHVYAGNQSSFLGAVEFSVQFGMEPCSSEEEYIEKIAPAVQRVCKKYGYLPSVLIAQSCLENGYGIPAYWDNPEISGLIYYCNMVGLKSELLSASWEDYTVWNGESIIKKTPEVYNGESVIITDSFRVYETIEQSFADFLLFLTYASNYGAGGTPKYGPDVVSITSPSKLIREVAKRGYATGTTYASSVLRIIKTHDLTKYDDLSGVEPTSYGP